MDIVSGKNLLGFRIPAGGIPSIRDKRDRDLQLLFQKYPQLKDKAITFNVLHNGPWIDEAFKSEELVIPKSDESVPPSAK